MNFRPLATRPRVVLLDEPFSALDRDLRRGLVADLRDFVRELKVPVLFVTHQRGEAHALGERLVLLEHGREPGGCAVDGVRKVCKGDGAQRRLVSLVTMGIMGHDGKATGGGGGGGGEAVSQQERRLGPGHDR